MQHTPLGQHLPHLTTAIPGPRSRAMIDILARHECPAVTARRARRAATLGTATDDPFVWAEARGANVVDNDGNVFVDLTAGFAVALHGHRHPAIVAALQRQTDKLLHAMGDAWPDRARIELLEHLADIAPGDLSVSLLGLSGADAVDAALKTAVLKTGRSGVLNFEGGYHGLALGVLGVQAYKAAFKDPFRDITHRHTRTAPWLADRQDVRTALDRGDVGLVLVEPLQGRGGVRLPSAGWLRMLKEEAHRAGALLAFDEIQCGLGRTGSLHEGVAQGVVPDLLCLGKALGGGVPLSACIGSIETMNAWGASQGEALHTQTFLGHPLACAAGLASLRVIVEEDLPAVCMSRGAMLRSRLEAAGFSVRGRGLMLGVELGSASFWASRQLLHRGFITLPAGQQAEVLCLTPPAVLSEPQIGAFVDALTDIMRTAP